MIGVDQHPDDNWNLGQRNGQSFLWRECTCDGWDSDDAPIEPGERHTRERVPDAPVEICYHRDETTHTITILRIRTMDS